MSITDPASIATVVSISGGIVSMIGAVWYSIYRHVTNTDRHPNKTKLIYRDLCESEKASMRRDINNQGILFNQRAKSIEEKIEAVHDLIDRRLNGRQ